MSLDDCFGRGGDWCQCDVCKSAYGEGAPTEGAMRDAYDADDAGITLSEYLSWERYRQGL